MIYATLSSNKNIDEINGLLSSIKGISGADLYSVKLDEISAVVCDINKIEVVADKENAIEYAEVIENIWKQFTLIPMRFGSILDSKDAISNMLSKNYSEFKDNLLKVENKCEFGLKVFCDSEKIIAELKENSNNEIGLTPSIENENTNSVFRNYIDKKLKEHRFEEFLLSLVDTVINEITKQLENLNAINKFKKMSSATNIVDAYILIEKENKNELLKMVKHFQNQYPSLNFILTGPWPPYNFVEINIK